MTPAAAAATAAAGVASLLGVTQTRRRRCRHVQRQRQCGVWRGRGAPRANVGDAAGRRAENSAGDVARYTAK